MFLNDKDIDTIFSLKKHEVLGEIERAKSKILSELSMIDKCTLSNIRETLQSFKNLETSVIDKVNLLESKITSFIKAYTEETFNIDLSQYRRDLDTIILSVASLTDDVNALKNLENLEGVTEQIKEITARIESLNNSVELIENISTTIQEMQNNIVNLSNTNTALGNRVTEFENSTNNRFTTNESNIINLTDKVNALVDYTPMDDWQIVGYLRETTPIEKHNVIVTGREDVDINRVSLTFYRDDNLQYSGESFRIINNGNAPVRIAGGGLYYKNEYDYGMSAYIPPMSETILVVKRGIAQDGTEQGFIYTKYLVGDVEGV